MAMISPVLNSTVSFWRAQPHALDNHRSTSDLPAEADIVIIGSGYSGASIAHHVLEQSKSSGVRPSIVILEAREACSGATGRNGGHLKPDPYYRAATALSDVSREAAEEVALFETRQVEEIRELIKRESIDCDYVVTRTSDVCMYDSVRDDLKTRLDQLAKAGISSAADVSFSDERTAEAVTGVKGARGCFTHKAATIWPYRLVLHLLSKAVAEGVNLQTHTPVQRVTSNPTGTWSIETPRGSTQATKVIHANNAYASTLLPEYEHIIIPVRGICCRIVATQARVPTLTNSYILRIAPQEYDYLIPRSDGSIIVGGARRDYWRDLEQWYGNVNDDELIEPAKNYFDGYMQRHFRGWEDSGAYTDQIWTGIMGYSSDGFPHVGNVPGKAGQYICAGFSGHGMPQIFLSAKAIASTVLDDTRELEIDLPQLYRTSQQRLDSKRNLTLEAWRAAMKEAVSKR